MCSLTCMNGQSVIDGCAVYHIRICRLYVIDTLSTTYRHIRIHSRSLMGTDASLSSILFGMELCASDYAVNLAWVARVRSVRYGRVAYRV